MNSKYLILLSFVFFFNSCRTVIFYSNDPVVTSQVNEKGDINLTAGINFSEYNTGIHFNGNLAITNNLFLGSSFTKFSKADNGINLSSNSDKFSGYNFNFLGGYYKPLENDFVFELGGGFQGGYNENRTNNIFTNINRQKIYIQPGISQINESFQWGFGVRIGVLDITKVESSDPDFTELKSGFDGAFLVEPGLNFSTGNIIKLGMQISYSFHDFTSTKPWGLLFGGPTTDDISFSFFLKIDINRSNKLPQYSQNLFLN